LPADSDVTDISLPFKPSELGERLRLQSTLLVFKSTSNV